MGANASDSAGYVQILRLWPSNPEGNYNYPSAISNVSPIPGQKDAPTQWQAALFSHAECTIGAASRVGQSLGLFATTLLFGILLLAAGATLRNQVSKLVPSKLL